MKWNDKQLLQRVVPVVASVLALVYFLVTEDDGPPDGSYVPEK